MLSLLLIAPMTSSLAVTVVTVGNYGFKGSPYCGRTKGGIITGHQQSQPSKVTMKAEGQRSNPMEEEKLVPGDLVRVVGGQWEGSEWLYRGCENRLVAVYLKAMSPRDEDTMVWINRCYVERVYRRGEGYRVAVEDYLMD
jgi:hypothetical protein